MFGGLQQVEAPAFPQYQPFPQSHQQMVQPQNVHQPSVFGTLGDPLYEHNQLNKSVSNQPLQPARNNTESTQSAFLEDQLRHRLGQFLQQPPERPVAQTPYFHTGYERNDASDFDTGSEHNGLPDLNMSEGSNVELDNDVDMLFPGLNDKRR